MSSRCRTTVGGCLFEIRRSESLDSRMSKIQRCGPSPRPCESLVHALRKHRSCYESMYCGSGAPIHMPFAEDDIWVCRWCGIGGHDFTECFRRILSQTKEHSEELLEIYKKIESEIAPLKKAFDVVSDLKIQVGSFSDRVAALETWKQQDIPHLDVTQKRTSEFQEMLRDFPDWKKKVESSQKQQASHFDTFLKRSGNHRSRVLKRYWMSRYVRSANGPILMIYLSHLTMKYIWTMPVMTTSLCRWLMTQLEEHHQKRQKSRRNHVLSHHVLNHGWKFRLSLLEM